MDSFWIDLVSVIASSLRFATPLILAAMGGILAERAGIIDIGLEGKMLLAAFTAAGCASVTGSVWLGLLAAIVTSSLLSLLHGLASIRYQGDQVVSGLSLNFIAAGLSIVLGHAWFGLGGQTPTLVAESRFLPLSPDWTNTDFKTDWPLLSSSIERLLFGHNALVYTALVSVFILAFLLYRTRFGLRLLAVGEAPQAVDSAGISVPRLRYLALLGCGILCGLAGAYYSIAHNAGFGRNMTAGGGFIALAAVIFGNWRPFPVLGACLFFGLLSALEARLQGVTLPILGAVPTQFFQALPYALTVLMLAGFIGRARPPKAIGKPYVKER